MWQVTENFRVVIGGNTYSQVGSIISYKGQSLFTLRRHDDGTLGIDFDIYGADGKKIATIKRNQVYEGNKDDYQLDCTADRCTLTEKNTGRIICEIKKRKEAEPAELEVSVDLYSPSGFHLEATPEGTNVGGGFIVKNSYFSNSKTAIEIG